MRIWAATRDMDKIIKEVVMDFPAAHSEDEKHLNELNTFRHTAFLPSDFMEGVDFSKFTLQLFPEKKKK